MLSLGLGFNDWNILIAGGPWTRIQGVWAHTGSGTTASATLGAPVGVNNTVVVWIWIESAWQGPITSVTDDKGNAYQLCTSGGDGNALYGAIFIPKATGLLTNRPSTFTVNTGPSETLINIAVEEFRPPNGTSRISMDGGNSTIRGDLTSQTSGTFITRNINDLIWSANVTTTPALLTIGAGFTLGQHFNAPAQYDFATEYQGQASPSSSTEALWSATAATATIICGVALSPTQSAIWQPVQCINEKTGSGTSAAVSFRNPVSAGNLVFVFVMYTPTAANPITTVVDDQSNSYALAAVQTVGPWGVAIYWSSAKINNAPSTITVNTGAASQTNLWISIAEMIPPPGKSTFAADGTSFAQSSGTALNAGNITTTKTGDLIFAGFISASGNIEGAAGLSALDSAGSNFATGFLVQQSAGTVAAQATNANGVWSAISMAVSAS